MGEPRSAQRRSIGYKKHLKRKPPKNLWHYTTLEGLLGIVRDSAVWLTDVRFLNDKREYLYASDVFDEVIAERKAKATPEDGLVLEQVTALAQIHNLATYDVYVASFSESDDQLSQWRAYAASARGVSLGFDLQALQVPEQRLSSGVFAPCVYSRRLQLAMVHEWIDPYGDLLRRIREKASGSRGPDGQGGVKFDPESDQIHKELVDFFGPDLMLESMSCFLDAGRIHTLMKHEAFSEEKEWRLVVVESRARKTPSPFKRLIRPGQSTLVPYISVPLAKPKERLSRLNSIRIAPHPDTDRALIAIREFLKANVLDHVEVEESKIPFRNW